MNGTTTRETRKRKERPRPWRRAGLLIAEERRRRWWTQEELATRAGLSRVRVKMYELGERLASPDAVSALARALGLRGHRFVELLEAFGYDTSLFLDAGGGGWLAPEVRTTVAGTERWLAGVVERAVTRALGQLRDSATAATVEAGEAPSGAPGAGPSRPPGDTDGGAAPDPGAAEAAEG